MNDRQLEVIKKIQNIQNIFEIETIIKESRSTSELEIIVDILNETLIKYLKEANEIQKNIEKIETVEKGWYNFMLNERKEKIKKVNELIKIADTMIDKMLSRI